jgi:hypothetical protein
LEADWEVEIGRDAVVIDAAWPRFVDLRLHPERVAEIEECGDFPALAQALKCLNSESSPVWTSKCDQWVVDDFAEFDRDEFAAADVDICAAACYIDLLARQPSAWGDAETAAGFCRGVVKQLREISLPVARVELVVRSAFLSAEEQAIGITAYVTGGGENAEGARARLGEALGALVQTLISR